MREAFRPRLVASDLDGTLLRSDKTISTDTRALLDRARRAGVVVVPATARQAYKLGPIAEQIGCDWVVSSNGALVVNLASGEVAVEITMSPDLQREVIARMRREMPDLEFVAVADRGRSFRTTPGYPELAAFTDHNRDPADMERVEVDQLPDRPALKLMTRHPDVAPEELALLLAGHPGVEATWSGAPLLEMSATGATKAGGVAGLATHLGIDLSEVVAYGDAANDITMLQAVGLGVAMPGSAPAVLAAADVVSPYGNDDDGVARHLAGLLDWKELFTAMEISA